LVERASQQRHYIIAEIPNDYVRKDEVLLRDLMRRQGPTLIINRKPAP
jgi:hypothetical protein